MNSVDELRPALSLHSCASAPEIYVCVCVCARARCAIWKVNGRNTSHALARPRERDSWSESKLKRASERDTHRIHTAYTHTQHTHQRSYGDTTHTHKHIWRGTCGWGAGHTLNGTKSNAGNFCTLIFSGNVPWTAYKAKKRIAVSQRRHIHLHDYKNMDFFLHKHWRYLKKHEGEKYSQYASKFIEKTCIMI